MTTLKSLSLILSICFSFSALALTHSPLRAKEIREDDITFRYTSSDGTFDLSCAHVFDEPKLNDWDVWCGKGTKLLRQFRVHLLIRELENRAAQKSAYEVLYWVIDRNQPSAKMFSSTSTWLQFNNLSDLQVMSFSQGIENDYAYLTVQYKPRR